jgi:uncharacterized protein (TIGR02145 family)
MMIKCPSIASVPLKINFHLFILILPVIPAMGSDYQIKFFAYPENSEIYAYSAEENQWKYERAPHEHFYILFEKQQEYEVSYGYSAKNLIAKYPFEFKSRHYNVISSYPLYAHTFGMSEETYQRLKPDSMVHFFSSFKESMVYANEILTALGRNTPDLTDSAFTPTEYVREVIRLNTLHYQPFTDPRDGQIYNTVQIGKQMWMAENLRFMPDGFRITSFKSETFGHFYDYETALCACPPGWHLSTKEEWDTLIAIAGGGERAVRNLKATDLWLYPENHPLSVSTDSLGFRVLPAGFPPYFKNGHTCFWTASQLHAGYIWVVTFTYYHREVRLITTINYEGLDRGQSVRCVKDYE